MPTSTPEAIVWGAFIIAVGLFMAAPSDSATRQIANALDHIATELRRTRRGEKH